MPRVNALRTIQRESHVARRIAHERERRGWTYDGMAKRMTDVGCAIHGSAIYKIEKADPPRRISVDELVAVATVFDMSVEDLLVPYELAIHHEAMEVLVQMRTTESDLVSIVDRFLGLAQRLIDLNRSQAHDEDVADRLEELWSPLSTARVGVDLHGTGVDGDQAAAIADAYARLVYAVLEVARGEHPAAS